MNCMTEYERGRLEAWEEFLTEVHQFGAASAVRVVAYEVLGHFPKSPVALKVLADHQEELPN